MVVIYLYFKKGSSIETSYKHYFFETCASLFYVRHHKA